MEKNRSVAFRTPPGDSLPQILPSKGGSLEELNGLLNLESEADWRLFLVAMCSYLIPPGPASQYPVTLLRGPHGSAKSTMSRVIHKLVDPVVDIGSKPKSVDDLAAIADLRWLVSFDNISGHLSSEISDELCKMATGGTLSKRRLYTNSEVAISRLHNPLILNGIDDISDRADLLERSVVISLEKLPTEGDRAYRSEEDYWREFESKRAGILGALLDLLSGAVAALPSVKLEKTPRMGNFAKLGEAIGTVLKWEPGSFVQLLFDNHAAAESESVESHPVTTSLRAFLESRADKNWEGTMTELLAELRKKADDETMRSKSWPTQPNALSSILNRMHTGLGKSGISVERSNKSNKKSRLYTASLDRTDDLPF